MLIDDTDSDEYIEDSESFIPVIDESLVTDKVYNINYSLLDTC